MVKINQESLLGSVVPNVFIKKITLETAGDIPVEMNPHIDHEREPNVVKNPDPPEGDGKVVRQPRNPDLLKKSEQSEPLRIKVDLIMKERLDNGFVSSWFGEQNFLKYLKIRIVQSREPSFTELFANRQLPLNIASFYDFFFYLGDLEHRLIPVDQILSDSTLDSKTFFIDEDGNQVYDVSFTQEFSLPNANVKHLSYFAVAFLDLEELAKDFDLDLPAGADRSLNGRIASELVINESEVVSESFVFRMEDGQIWSGEVHQIEEGRWKTGTEDDTTSKFLELSTIPNQKIQDFRDVKEVERLLIDLSVLENEILRRTNSTTILTNDRLDVERKKNYLSDCCLSRDRDGNVRFSFAIDMNKMARENTKFGALYRDDNEELLEEIKIRSIKLLRARVKGDDFYLKDERGLRIFDEEEEPIEMLIIAGETEPGQFVDRSTDKAAIREFDVFLEEETMGVRHFTGIDKTMQSVTYGKYQYGIEIEVEDRTASYLINKLDEILFATQALNTFYLEGENSNNFDVASNQYTQQFIETVENRYKNDEENAPWVLSTSAYLSTMDILIKDFDATRFEQCLISFTHPRSGNPSSILSIIKLMENLSIKLASLAGTNIAGKVNKFNPGQSQWKPQSALNRSPGIPLRTFKIEKYFPNIFDSDLPKSIGYDFLFDDQSLQGEPNDDGLLVVSNAEYRERTEKETLKYYKAIDSNINLKSEKVEYTLNDSIENSRYSFLTPSVIRLGAKKGDWITLNKNEDIYNVEQYQKMSTNIMRYNQLLDSSFSPFFDSLRQNRSSNISSGQQAIKTNLQDFWAQRSLTIVNPRVNKKMEDMEETAETSEQSQPFVKADRFVAKTSKFLKQDFIVSENNNKGVGSLENIERKDSTNPNRLLFAMSYPMIQKGPSSNLTFSKKEDQKQIVNNTINFWDLRTPKNALDLKFVGDKSDRFNAENPRANAQEKQRLLNVTQNIRNTAAMPLNKQSYIQSLPNQIKSLFVGSLASNIVKKNWFSEFATSGKDPMKDPEQKLVFDMNYKILSKIEVLVGFERGTNTDTNLQIKSPIWRTLTLERFNQSVDKNLICRMKEYQDKELNVQCPKSLRLPVYNEHFILSPENSITKPVNPTKQNKFEKTRQRAIQLHLNQQQLRPEFSRSLITAVSRTPGSLIRVQDRITSPIVAERQASSRGFRNVTFESRVSRFRLK